jgi:hypothetical protein
LAVLVPVLGRPQNVVPLVRSFVESGTPGQLRFVVTLGDDEEHRAVVDAQSHNVGRTEGHAVTWPEKINLGVESIAADWYLCAADDIRFTPGWWDATRELRNGLAGVIGTNDALPGTPGNPAVAAGSHTCHPLIRASYIREYGTIDEKGKAVHDGYRHWCVDNELVVTAMIRDRWAFCREAVLIHDHPYWGRGTWDATYQLGETNNQADLELWRWRAKHLLGVDVQQ